jgi:hypothetical protein
VNGAVKENMNTVSACPGDSISFKIEAGDPNGDNVTMTTNLSSAIPDATFDTTCHCDPVVGTFGWQPSALDTGMNSFTVKLEDDGCPILAARYYTYHINVLRQTYAFGDTTYCSAGDSVQLHAVGGNSFSWSPTNGLSDPNVKDPKAAPSSTTEYVVTSDLSNTCKNKDTVTVHVVSDINVDAGPNDTICQGNSTQLDATVGPNNQSPFTYNWSPSGSLSEDTVEDPIASPTTTTDYALEVTSDSGCTVTDTTTVAVEGKIPQIQATANEYKVCQGDTTQLHALSYAYFDDFNDGMANFWADTNGVATNTDCGSMSGDALHYNGSGDRYAETNDFNTSSCGQISFCLKAGDGSSPCETADAGEDMVLEYSNDGGATWDTIQVFDQSNHTSWGCVDVSIPGAAQTSSTRFRWAQYSHSGNDFDNWAIDDVGIMCSSSSYTYNWSPGSKLDDSTSTDPIATINEPTTFEVQVTDTAGDGCTATESVTIEIDSSLLVDAVQDTTLCQGDSTRLHTNVTGTPTLKCHNCGANGTSCTKPQNTYQVGYGTSSSSTYGPFYQTYEDFRIQFLYRASDLDSLMQCGTLNEIAFYVASKNSSRDFRNFTIKIGCTNASELSTSGWEPTSATVFGPTNYSTTTGWNTFAFSQSFDWDGQSNLVVEVCWDNNNASSSDQVEYHSTSFNATMRYYTDGANGCNLSPSYNYTSRPNTRFTHCEAEDSSFSYTWSPSSQVDDSDTSDPIAYKSSDDWDTLNVTVTGGRGCDAVQDEVLLKNCTVLPIDALQFDVQKRSESVAVNWELTSTQNDVRHYELQRLTGEKGFEIYFDKNEADPEEIWNKIMKAGSEFDIEACGLGARDTLRLEMGFALYGNDITKDTHPLEARLGWLTKLDKGKFIGRDALKKVKEDGLSRKLVGFTIDDKRSIPRKGYDIVDEHGEKIGEVTSGSRSITLGKNIGMGYVSVEYAEEGSSVYIEIRNKKAEAIVENPPFIKK